jgi:hypothetical protein
MHHSRLCAVLIDCNTPEVDGAKPGAKVVDRLERWVVMQAPTGQRFGVVRVQRSGFPKNANRWG